MPFAQFANITPSSIVLSQSVCFCIFHAAKMRAGDHALFCNYEHWKTLARIVIIRNLRLALPRDGRLFQTAIEV